ncbi:hypothetical protein MP228_005546 [Amoeboaphelidium protococcarum]|nr:hypothetical protein MP228_005546 [Amoeboaphelidium protococcarum]
MKIAISDQVVLSTLHFHDRRKAEQEFVVGALFGKSVQLALEEEIVVIQNVMPVQMKKDAAGKPLVDTDYFQRIYEIYKRFDVEEGNKLVGWYSTMGSSLTEKQWSDFKQFHQVFRQAMDQLYGLEKDEDILYLNFDCTQKDLTINAYQLPQTELADSLDKYKTDAPALVDQSVIQACAPKFTEVCDQSVVKSPSELKQQLESIKSVMDLLKDVTDFNTLGGDLKLQMKKLCGLEDSDDIPENFGDLIASNLVMEMTRLQLQLNKAIYASKRVEI